MNMYCVYDTWDNDVYVMRGSAKLLGRAFKCSPKRIRENAKSGYLIHGRWKIVRELD